MQAPTPVCLFVKSFLFFFNFLFFLIHVYAVESKKKKQMH